MPPAHGARRAPSPAWRPADESRAAYERALELGPNEPDRGAAQGPGRPTRAQRGSLLGARRRRRPARAEETGCLAGAWPSAWRGPPQQGEESRHRIRVGLRSFSGSGAYSVVVGDCPGSGAGPGSVALTGFESATVKVSTARSRIAVDQNGYRLRRWPGLNVRVPDWPVVTWRRRRTVRGREVNETGNPLAVESVTVKVKLVVSEFPSAKETLLIESVGTASSFVIVPVATPSQRWSRSLGWSG